MPAHISIREGLELRAGYALRHHAGLLHRVGLHDIAGHGISATALPKTAKGRAALGWNDDDGNDATTAASLSELKQVQEKMRVKREIVCTSYQQCRDALNAFNGSKELFPKSAPSFAATFSTLSSAKGYSEKDHAAFKMEWELFLKPGTAFDDALQQLFAQGWNVTLIKGRNEHSKQLKRMEGKKPGKPMKILWTQ